jgi:hypothetical protein
MQDSVDRIGPGEKEEILNQMPRGEVVYVHENPIEPTDSAVSVPMAIRNRASDNISPSFSMKCVSCGGTTMTYTTTSRTIRPGDTAVMQGLLSNESWSPGQHTMLLNVTNQTGGEIGATTIIVQN